MSRAAADTIAHSFSSGSSRPDSSSSLALPTLLIVIVTLLALWPVATFDFTLWDDNGTIAENPNLNPPTLAGLTYHWTHSYMELYVPVTYTAWWLLANVARVPTGEAGGAVTLNPWIFHTANLVIHVLTACLVFRLLVRLGLPRWPAAAGALVFAVHPVQVETVAWASGLKDLLCGLFSIIAIDQYVAFATRRDERRAIPLAISLIAFITALLAKPTAVAVPLIFFVIDTLILRRPPRKALRGVAAFVVLAIPFVVVGSIAQPPSLIAPIPLWWRPFVAGDAVAFYLLKIVAPVRLGIDYGRTPKEVIASGAAFITILVPIALAWAVWRCRSAPLGRTLLAAAAIFVVALAPVLGLVPFEFQARSTVADHYLYLPMLGVALAFATIIARLRPPLGAVLVIGAIAALGTRTWLATRPWRDSPSLFNHALVVNPNSAAAENNLLLIAMDNARPDEVLSRARHLLDLAPDLPETQFNYGHALALNGHYAEAAETYRRAIARWPQRTEAYRGLAAALVDLGRADEALRAYDAGLKVAPNDRMLLALRQRVAARVAAPSRPSP